MTALFEKDMRLIFIRKSVLYMYLVIGVVFSCAFSSSFSGAYLTMLGTILALSTLSYDDSDNCMEFLFTLPCTRKQYVMEKYLFVYGFSLAAGLIGMIIGVIAGSVKGEPVDSLMFVEIIASEVPIFVIIGGIMIPLQLKFGPERTRVVFLLIFGTVFGIAFLISRISKMVDVIADFAIKLDSMSMLSLAAISAVILIVFSLISVFISIKIIEKKEF